MAILFESLLANLLVTSVTLGALLYWYFTSTFDYWAKRNVRFIKPLPFFGNFIDRILLRKSFGEIWIDHYKALEGHKMGGVWFARVPILVIREPDLLKQVLVKDFAYFHDRGIDLDEKRNPLTAHLFGLSGSRWRALRTKMTPTFTSGKMKMMFTLMNECAREFAEFVAESARGNGEVEFKEALAKFTTDVIGSCAFGLQFNSIKNPDSEFRAMGRKVFAPPGYKLVLLTLSQFAPALGKLLRIRVPEKEVSDFFLGAVRETVEYREKNNVKRNDFLQLLIELKHKGTIEGEYDSKISPNGLSQENSEAHDFEFTDNLLAAQAFIFFLAGFETSSTAMSFALHELTVNSEIQKKARDEVDRVLKESGGQLTYEALGKMEYIERIINESLRKYPPVPTLQRVCTKTYRESITGVVIDEGTRVQIPVHALHHDPKYFPDPERFDPDRFTEEEKAKRPHYAFLPFGEGPRVCIGLRFGMLQAKLGLATLLSRFELAASPRTLHPLVLDPKALITGCQGGVWAHVIPREITSEMTEVH